MLEVLLRELREVRRKIGEREGPLPLYLSRIEEEILQEVKNFFERLEKGEKVRIVARTSFGRIWFPGKMRNLIFNGKKVKVWMRGNFPPEVKVDYQIELPLENLEDIQLICN